MTKHDKQDIDSVDRPAQEIEITPEMIEAGYEELREHPLGADLHWLAQKVYMAMLYAGPLGSLAASSSADSK